MITTAVAVITTPAVRSMYTVNTCTHIVRACHPDEHMYMCARPRFPRSASAAPRRGYRLTRRKNNTCSRTSEWRELVMTGHALHVVTVASVGRNRIRSVVGALTLCTQTTHVRYLAKYGTSTALHYACRESHYRIFVHVINVTFIANIRTRSTADFTLPNSILFQPT